jgi:phosphohistidine swiveling domain-containing protein
MSIKTSADSWDGLLVNYLKADNLKTNEETFVCIGVDVSEKDMDLQLERKDEKFVFSLNVTNKVFLKNSGITSPKAVIGKKITLKKVVATNPTSKKEVDSLRISKVE